MTIEATTARISQGTQRIGGTPPAGGPPPGEGPQGAGGPPPAGGKDPRAMLEELTASMSEEKRTELFSTIDSMRESGASFEEVKSYVDDTLKANGIEPPTFTPGQEGGAPSFFVDTYA